jgi:hypothetical protein
MSPNVQTTTHQEPLPSLNKFQTGTNIVKRIENIARFSFRVQYQKSAVLTAPEAVAALMHDGYAVLNDLFETSGIHYLHALEAKSTTPDSNGSEPPVQFRFGHDRLFCNFQYGEDNFEIIRRSSSFADFYSWYTTVMPEALRIEMTLRQIIQRATGHTLRPVQSLYEFIFNFSDFRMPNDPEARPRNMNVIEEIINSIPGPGKTMTRPSTQELYRLDLTISKREVFGEKARNTWITVEAPFNQEGRFVVFTAQLRNAATEVLKHNKVISTSGFDPDFGSDYRIALIDFLRDSALEDFAYQLLRHWEFETEREL